MKKQKFMKMIKVALVSTLMLLFVFAFLQFYWVHREGECKNAKCVPLLGWFTREDRLLNGRVELKDLQPGDILVTLSTHSMGWRHGHAGLMIDEERVLECVSLGTNSTVVSKTHWETYSNIAVLRVKGVTEETRENVVKYALKNLYDVPYHLTSGFLGKKAPAPDAVQFGLHCSYLVWYAWNQFGYDLDSDGGRLVTSYDLMKSEKVEMIKSYGMEEFL